MDVQQYFDPVDFPSYSGKSGESWTGSLGQMIEKSMLKLASGGFQDVEIAIIGVPCDNGDWQKKSAKAPDKIREELYRLTDWEDSLPVIDFGNLKFNNQKGVALALRDIIEYLDELQVTTVVLGGSEDLSFGICEAFKNHPFFSLTVIDSVLDIKKSDKETSNSSNHLTRIFNSNPNLFQFSLLGYQSHFVSQQHFKKISGTGNHLRLGILRDELLQAEPILRNSHVALFDIAAVKYAEAPGTHTVNPNGLRSEEACQLASYAGMSETLKVFGLFGVKPDKDNNNLTIKLSAQIVWYFLDGCRNRSEKNKDFLIDKLTFRVEVKNLDKPLIFYFSEVTNRWWFEIQSINGEKYILACSEKDYLQASNNEIPELWLKYIQKIDDFSK